MMIANGDGFRGASAAAHIIKISADRIFVRLRNAVPIKLAYPSDGRFIARNLRAEVDPLVLPCPDLNAADGVNITVTTGTGRQAQVVAPGASASFTLSDSPGTIEIIADPLINPECDNIILTFGF